MNKQDRIEEQEYIDLYNKGYGLHKFSPEISELLISAQGKGVKLEAVKSGIEQAKSEHEPSRLPNWLQKDRFDKNNKDIYQSKEKDIEPEKD